MSKFGVFANLVAIAGSLAAAAAAISLAFLKQANWRPPEEAIPAAVPRMSALISMIFIAMIYVFGVDLGRIGLGILAGGLLFLALFFLAIAIHINTAFSFYYPNRKKENRKLGGDTLTDEAQEIKREKRIPEQQLFEDAQGSKDLVWTRASQSRVQIKAVLSFIGLIAFGTCALAAASMLVALFVPTS
ncbi:hypothetical protein [Bradyrhizobium roseum]|uniref:hypothetical protein n=1 Tax=Bradyrhizobium roseum TaxID=3056648 RepID=UPI0026220D17|nr:hypothetical protein [Bradyrhizobium roseus]WKA27502.1 hypothetical protein QUH67_28635 [Bradyrhizobium roseus]